MEGTKKFWQSKGMIGGFAAVVAGVLGLWKIQVSVENLTEVITYGTSFAGGIIAMIGRAKATKKIG